MQKQKASTEKEEEIKAKRVRQKNKFNKTYNKNIKIGANGQFNRFCYK